MPPLSLTALPTEILNQIMTYQEEGTLASLRLTYHLLCEVATPRLFYEFLIQIGREDEHLMTLGQPYLHHIQWLYILASAWITSRFTELDDVYRDCAFHNLDLFDRMPRLRRLWLEGCYSCDGTSDFNAPGSSNDGVDREIDPAEKATQMAMFLRRRSLLAAPEDRIATSLSFCSFLPFSLSFLTAFSYYMYKTKKKYLSLSTKITLVDIGLLKNLRLSS